VHHDERYPHCQGCGLAEGQARVAWHNKKLSGGTWQRIRRTHEVCVLRSLDLGGLGERRYCQHCWHLGLLENARLQQPDFRQLKVF
jgi:hypothetical protein